ncbi:MAG: hypothetical protein IJU43_02895 [Lachnospiraceae bacterium]|nr:hypothetical protein [Lachnospiraceae bacterium]
MKKTVLFILGAMIIMCLGGCGGQKSKPVLNGSGTEKSASSAKEETADNAADTAADTEKPADEDTSDTDNSGKKAAVDTDKADAEKAEVAEDNGDTDKAGDAENADDAGASGDLITEVQAVDAITDYCYEQNPDLKDIVEAGEYPVYWDISSSDDKEIVVVFRSYTGALTYYHIDPATGDTYVTELVPGIIDEEQRTDETLNVRDYIK